ncbi:replication fork protection component Swi3-domain-containing protein [Infundibulicybe gibba]|nr:replication fork protection component Swi3-domain-containing protein [Infundibulicybe gibba]
MIDEDSPRPAKRQRPALFLSDSDEDDEKNDASKLQQNAPPELDIDIDAMFAGVEDDEDDELFNPKPMAAGLDVASLEREAEARHKKAAPSLTPYQVMPSSSPPRDVGHTGEQGQTKEKDEKKPKKKVARLDEARLLGPDGFPQLIKDTKHFKIRGKGHEAADLNRILQIYQFWTHRLYPKTPFKDTVNRVEKLCHSRRMNVSLSVWRDEAHGIVREKKAGAPSDEEDEDVVEAAEVHHASSPSGRSADDRGRAPSSQPPSHPPTSGTEADEDDWDFDAAIREEVARNAARGLQPTPDDGALPPSSPPQSDAPQTFDGDDDAVWAELDAMNDAAPSALSAPPANPNTSVAPDEDDEMWNQLDAMEESRQPVTASTPGGDDTEMQDIINQMEDISQPEPQPPPASITQDKILNPDGVADLSALAAEDDWEDMYV